MAEHRRHPRPPRLRRPDRASVIAAVVFLVVAAGVVAALIWGRISVAGCYSGTGSRWC